jgi:hypothetical protein
MRFAIVEDVTRYSGLFANIHGHTSVLSKDLDMINPWSIHSQAMVKNRSMNIYYHRCHNWV